MSREHRRRRRPGHITVHADVLSDGETVGIVPPRGAVQQIVSITTDDFYQNAAQSVTFRLTNGNHGGLLGRGTYPSEGGFQSHKGGALITNENYLSLSFEPCSGYYCFSAASGVDSASYNIVLMEV